MKYTDLLKVLAIYEERSFTAAAKRLYLTQPAISQNITQLEKELNVLLFIRDNGRITPTPACEKFVLYAYHIVEQWQALEKEMKAYRPDNELHIGTTSFFFQFLAYKTEAMFVNQPMELKYTIIEDTAANIERLVNEGKLDFCFTRVPLHLSTLKFEPFFTEEIVLALPADHPVCQRYPATASDPYPVINLEEFRFSDFVMVNNPRISPLCYKMCEAAGYQPRITMQPTSWEHVIMGIRTGRGVGFVSNLHIKRGDSDDLRFFHIDSEFTKMEHVVAYRSTYDLTADARQFINSFRNYVQKNLEPIG